MIFRVILPLIALLFFYGQQPAYAQYNLGGSVWFDSPLITYDPDAQMVFDAFSTSPSSEDKANINTLILALKSAGAWDKLDVLWVMASGTQQAGTINWKDPGTHTITLTNSPVFTAYEGFTFNGSSNYANTNFSPLPDAVNYSQNSASFSIYVRNNIDQSGTHAVAGTSPFEVLQISPRISNVFYGRINNRVAAFYSVANTDSRAMWTLVRSSSTDVTLYENGASQGTQSITSTGIPNLPLYIGCWNNSGVPQIFVANQVAFVAVGGSLTQVEADAQTDAFEVYMDAYGKGIIP